MKMKENKRAVKFFTGFLVLMLIMTFVSRIVYTRSLPVVSVKSVKSERLTNVISCSGTVEPTSVKTVYLPEDLTVEMISAFEGKTVAEGDELLRLDLKKLEEKAQKLKTEINEEKQNAIDVGTGTSVFAEPDMPVKSVTVKKGDKVKKGDLLFTIDTDRLCYFINELETERNNEIINRDACTAAIKKAEKEKQDDIVAQQKTQEAIYNSGIAQKQRKIDRYMRVLNNYGNITAPCGGVVTAIKIGSGDTTTSAAAMLIGKSEKVGSAVMEKKKLLEEYNALIKNGGSVASEIAGTVTAVNIAAGQLTTSAAAISISDDSAPVYFRADLTEDQARKIAAGDGAELMFRNGRVRLNCTVESVTKLPTGQGYRAAVPIESDKVVCGDIGQLKVRITDEEEGVCVPRSAVRGAENKRYVYLLVTEDGFLGEEYHAERVSVTEQNSNDIYVSLSSGLSEGAYVICSEKELTDGQTVRLRNEPTAAA